MKQGLSLVFAPALTASALNLLAANLSGCGATPPHEPLPPARVVQDAPPLAATAAPVAKENAASEDAKPEADANSAWSDEVTRLADSETLASIWPAEPSFGIKFMGYLRGEALRNSSLATTLVRGVKMVPFAAAFAPCMQVAIDSLEQGGAVGWPIAAGKEEDFGDLIAVQFKAEQMPRVRECWQMLSAFLPQPTHANKTMMVWRGNIQTGGRGSRTSGSKVPRAGKLPPEFQLKPNEIAWLRVRELASPTSALEGTLRGDDTKIQANGVVEKPPIELERTIKKELAEMKAKLQGEAKGASFLAATLRVLNRVKVKREGDTLAFDLTIPGSREAQTREMLEVVSALAFGRNGQNASLGTMEGTLAGIADNYARVWSEKQEARQPWTPPALPPFPRKLPESEVKPSAEELEAWKFLDFDLSQPTEFQYEVKRVGQEVQVLARRVPIPGSKSLFRIRLSPDGKKGVKIGKIEALDK
jgi:hypothetical protein